MSASGGIDSRRVYAAVTEDIHETDDVLELFIVAAREQMPQIVRKYLFRRYLRLFRKPLHHPPDVAAVQRLA